MWVRNVKVLSGALLFLGLTATMGIAGTTSTLATFEANITGVCSVSLSTPVANVYTGPELKLGQHSTQIGVGAVTVSCNNEVPLKICFGGGTGAGTTLSDRFLESSAGDTVGFILKNADSGFPVGDKGCQGIDAGYGAETHPAYSPVSRTVSVGNDATVNLLGGLKFTSSVPAGSYVTEVPIVVVW